MKVWLDDFKRIDGACDACQQTADVAAMWGTFPTAVAMSQAWAFGALYDLPEI